MRSYVTDPDAPRGLRLDEDAPEPRPAPDEAVLAVEAFGVNRGELALLATGAVGQFAIQLARAAGAHVTALVSRSESVPEAEAAGAHAVVTDLADGPGGYRLVSDGAGGDVLRQALHHLAPHGVVATYGAMAGRTELGLADLLSVADPRIVGLVHSEPPDTRGADLGVLAGQVAAGALRPRIGLSGDWADVRDALDAMADHRVRGKVVLTVS